MPNAARNYKPYHTLNSAMERKSHGVHESIRGGGGGERAPLLALYMEKRWFCPLLLTTAIFILFLLNTFNMGYFSSFHTISTAPPPPPSSPSLPPPPPAASPIPRLAYLVSGSKGDLEQMWRLLRAIYHPHNLYLLHLDLESPSADRSELASRVAADPVFARVGNIHVVVKANMVTYRGPTMVANTLHACAVLLRKSRDWDWFVNLSASDYPLMTQDDILHTFASLPKNISFLEHTSRLEWKKEQRARPLIIDPGLYKSQKSDVFWATEKRGLPTAFKLFTGSAWVVLTREFVEFCVWGWDNLPRTLLMYYANFLSSPEGYFHTVICNAPDFRHTVANHDLHYISWDSPPKQHPHILTAAEVPKMVGSNAAFARKFQHGDPALDRIDTELLGGRNRSYVPGGWCAGSPPCSEVGEPTRLQPGPGAKRLAVLMDGIVLSNRFRQNQCM